MRVLVACEFSGVVRRAFTEKGHEAWSADYLPALDKAKNHYIGDCREVLKYGWDLMIAHPPCTYLTVAANKYYNPEIYGDAAYARLQKREEALQFVNELLEADIPKIALENPVGVISSRIRKPSQVVQPYYFGDDERKSTCLWLKNLPLLKPTNVVQPNVIRLSSGKTDSASHLFSLGLDKRVRGYVRSITFEGFAKAMAEQWG